MTTRLPQSFTVQQPQHGLNLLLAIQNLSLMASESDIAASILLQAAKALRDKPMVATLEAIRDSNARQRQWLTARMRLAAAQVLLVPL